MKRDLLEWINQVVLGKETGLFLPVVCVSPEGRIAGLPKGCKDHLMGIQVYQ